ncbi:MAG: hypothetical protein CYPHOPRED_004462 [Cyphobasidiales sp. Tagirdzhanova-0007]|nr:MAG: hypothetical protein CYPHOPRED_004462 [Cyphobasidiales sp. Tagirdzhanova-0007]
MLRRSSSTSTLGSIDGDEDQHQPEEETWSEVDVAKLLVVYEQCVDEASFDTPFSGPPPSQLLHTIARACRRIYSDEWKHSVTQTRTKCLALIRLRLAEGLEDEVYQPTPRPGADIDATPKRRRIKRNDSMDFLPYTTRNFTTAARLSSKLQHSGEASNGAMTFPARIRTDSDSLTLGGGLSGNTAPRSAPIPSIGRLARSMTFTSLSSIDDAGSSSNNLSYSPGTASIARAAYKRSASARTAASGRYHSSSHSQPSSLYTVPVPLKMETEMEMEKERETQWQDGGSEHFHLHLHAPSSPRKKRNYDSGYASSHDTSDASSAIARSTSSLSLSTSTSADSEGDGEDKNASSVDTDAASSLLLDPRYVSAGINLFAASPRPRTSSGWPGMPWKEQRTASSASSSGRKECALESPFEGSLVAKKE